MTDRWLTAGEAVALVRKRLECSEGYAQAQLAAAIRSGEVRDENPDRPILLMADDGIVDQRRRVFGTAQISENDLTDWLDRNHGAPSPPALQRDRAQEKRDRAKQAIGALWPRGIPGGVELSNKNLTQQVARWIAADCKTRQIPVAAPSDDTILRAAGRK